MSPRSAVSTYVCCDGRWAASWGIIPTSSTLSQKLWALFTPRGWAVLLRKYSVFIGVIAPNFVALHQTRERACKMCKNSDWHPDRQTRERDIGNEAIQYTSTNRASIRPTDCQNQHCIPTMYDRSRLCRRDVAETPANIQSINQSV